MRRAAAIVLGLTLATSLVPMPGHADCTESRSSQTSHDGHHATPPASDEAALVQQDQPACDHCETYDCIMAASCGGAAVTLVATGRNAPPSAFSPRALGNAWRPIPSFPSSPPTPPPTLIL